MFCVKAWFSLKPLRHLQQPCCWYLKKKVACLFLVLTGTCVTQYLSICLRGYTFCAWSLRLFVNVTRLDQKVWNSLKRRDVFKAMVTMAMSIIGRPSMQLMLRRPRGCYDNWEKNKTDGGEWKVGDGVFKRMQKCFKVIRTKKTFFFFF